MSDDNNKKAAAVLSAHKKRHFSAIALEPRMLLDAAAAATGAEILADAKDSLAVEKLVADPSLLAPAASGDRHAVFIDTSVENYTQLLMSISPDAEVFFIDGSKDGLTQMLAALDGSSGYKSIQIYSHGGAGQLQLGNGVFDLAALNARQGDVARLGEALAADGDILIYGCNVGAGDTGRLFVDRLSALSGADVAASEDMTGASRLGADWDLEVSRGQIDSASALGEQGQSAFASVLATGWTDVNAPVNSDNAANDEHGWSVAMSDHTTAWIVAGGWSQGDVYAYKPIGAGEYQEYKFPAPSAGTSTGGISVDVDGNFAIIGYRAATVGANANAGRIYVYEYVTGSGTWVERATFTGTAANHNFGWDVAIQAEGGLYRAVVGAPGSDSGRGRVYTYYSTTSGASWTAGSNFTSPATGSWTTEVQYGRSVAIDGNVIAAGAPGYGTSYSCYACTDDRHSEGRVWAYNWTSGNAAMQDVTADLTGQTDNLAANARFGESIDLSVGAWGELLAIGAPSDSGVGEVYVYRDKANRTQYTPAGRVDEYGYSVGVDSNTGRLVVGEPYYTADTGNDGKVWMATISGTNTWSDDTSFVSPQDSSRYGWSVAIARDLVAIGSPWNDSDGSDSPTNDQNGVLSLKIKNVSPVANADSSSVGESGTVNINVLANDTDANNLLIDVLGITDVSPTVSGNGSTSIVSGQIQFNTDGAFEYLRAGQNAVETFTYTVSDAGHENIIGTVTVTVNGANDPVLQGDAIGTQQGNANQVNTLPTVTALNALVDADIGDTYTYGFVKAGTYTQSGTTTITVTATAHGLAVGNPVYLDFLTGTAADKSFTVASVISANQFTVTDTVTRTTSGNVNAGTRATTLVVDANGFPGDVSKQLTFTMNATTGAISFNPGLALRGYTYTLPGIFGSDAGTGMNSTSFNVTVMRANVAPTATIGTLSLTAWEDNKAPGTYSQAGTAITVTSTATHGLTVGSEVNLDFLTGTAVDSTYLVTSVISGTQFTVTDTVSRTTSGSLFNTVNNAVSLTPQFSDADTSQPAPYNTEALSYELIGAPTWMSIGPFDGKLQFYGVNENVGTVTFTVRATDEFGLSVDKSVQVTLNPVNDAPGITNEVDPEPQAFLGVTYANADVGCLTKLPADLFTDTDVPTPNTFTLTATFADGRALGTAGPGTWLRFDAASGRFYSNGAVSGDSIGTVLSIKVTATDTGSPALSNSYFFDINVFPQPGSNGLVATPTGNNQAGYSVAMSENGNWMLVGEPRYDSTGNDNYRGQATLYAWNGTAWNAVGVVGGGATDNTRFGFSVDLDSTGNVLAIGAPGLSKTVAGTYSQSGFTVTVTTGVTPHGLTVGTPVTMNYTSGTASDASYEVASIISATQFTVQDGVSRTTSGNANTLVPYEGSAYTMTRTELAGTYNQAGTTTITVTTAAAHGLAVGNVVYGDFTSGLATDRTFTVASVISTTQFTVTDSVARTTSGNILASKFSALTAYTQTVGTGTAGSAFGSAIALDRTGTKLVVGAPQEDSARLDGGAVYLYNVGTAAQLAKQLPTADAGEALTFADRFGTSLDFDGSVVIVGAPYDSTANGFFTGSATLLGVNGTGFNGAVRKFIGAESGDFYGWDVAVDLHKAISTSGADTSITMAVGAPGSDLKDFDAGAVYAYRSNAMTASVTQTNLNSITALVDPYSLEPLTAYDGMARDRFGISVALDAGGSNDVATDGVRLVVGSAIDGSGQGAAYLHRDWFSVTGNSWIGQRYLQSNGAFATTPAENQYSWSVAVAGLTSTTARVAVGAPNADLSGVGPKGAVYSTSTSGSPIESAPAPKSAFNVDKLMAAQGGNDSDDLSVSTAEEEERLRGMSAPVATTEVVAPTAESMAAAESSGLQLSAMDPLLFELLTRDPLLQLAAGGNDATAPEGGQEPVCEIQADGSCVIKPQAQPDSSNAPLSRQLQQTGMRQQALSEAFLAQLGAMVP